MLIKKIISDAFIGAVLEYTALNSLPYYKDCAPLVEGMGYILIEMNILRQKETTKITAVIAPKDPQENIGVDACAKIHYAMLARLEAVLKTDNIYMEITSPGMERNIKNAAEFPIFIEKNVRIWDKTVSDWIRGKIKKSDNVSVTLETEDGSKTIHFENIAKAKFIHL